MAELIRKTDTLNEGREKLNAAITDAEKAKVDAGKAVDTSGRAEQIAQTAEDKADNVQSQFNQVIIEGDSSVEAAQARVTKKGETYDTLKARLDAENAEVTSQLNVTKVVNSYRNQSTLNNISSGGKKRLISLLDGELLESTGNPTIDIINPHEIKLRITTSGTSRVRLQATRDFGAINNSACVDLVARCLDWDKINRFSVYLAPNENEPLNRYGARFYHTKGRDYSKSHLLRVYSSDFASNTLDKPMNLNKNSIITFEFETTDPVDITFYNGLVEYTPPPVVLIHFDDNNRAAHNWAVPEMAKRGIPGSWHVNTATVQEGSLTWEMLNNVQSLGWTVGNHTPHHTNLLSVPIEEAMEEVEKGAWDLSKKGMNGSEFLAAPQNSMSDELAGYLKHTTKVIRVGMYAPGSLNALYGTRLTPPPSNRVSYLHAHSVTNQESPQDIINNHFTPAKSRGLACILTFHQISPTQSSDAYTYLIDDFVEILDLLIEEGAVFATSEGFYNAFLNPDAEIYGNQR